MKKIFTSIILLLAMVSIARAQAQYQPYSYDFYQKFDEQVYSTSSSEHTAMKPYIIADSALKAPYDSIMNSGADGKLHGWGYKKLFNEHLIELNGGNSTFYADLLPDFTIGKNFSGGKENTSLVSYGLQFGGTIGDKLYYSAMGFENQGTMPEYITNYINQTGIIPGEAVAKVYGYDNYDWRYFTGVISYTPSKFLNITFGQDKTFIGDGYRSMLLSDFASPYPFLKVTANIGPIKYMAMWAHFNDPTDLDSAGNVNKKWGVFHYLDWNVTKRFTFGFFDSIIWPNRDNDGNYRGFEVTYLNPITFLRPLEASNGSPDNALIGFTGKYKITDGITFYSQFTLDEFESKNFFSDNGSSRNKYAEQFGIRGANLFNVKGLNYLLEYNTAKPYTYSERGQIENYAENGEPLAHPWGANFREVVGLLNYAYKRFNFSGEGDFGHYGLDINGQNYGKDPFQDYTYPVIKTGDTPGLGYTLNNYTGQGLTTNMYYLEGKVAYVLNPKYNLRVEVGALYRDEKNSQFDDKTTMLTFGIRSSFRAIYNDITSFNYNEPSTLSAK